MLRQLLLPPVLLFIALGVPSNAQNADVTVEEGAPLTVECALRVEERAEWRKDGGAVPSDMRPAGEAAAAGKLTARLTASAARAQHAGEYTCARQPATRVRVHVRPAPGRPAPVRPASSSPAGEAPATGAAGAAGAGSAASVGDVALELTYYDVGRAFSFNCTIPRTADAGGFVWRKNGTVVSEVWDLNERYKLEEGGAVFRLSGRSAEDDFGNYTCALGGAAPAQGWELRGRPYAKLPANTNVVEGQKLKLVCRVVGKPYPEVKWTVANSSEEGNATDVTLALGARAVLARSEQGVAGAELVLEAAQRADAGVYSCVAADGLAATTLRVKDMYAALWPFLGICAEVFVLCAIILVYEKRRTKPELDDSDTDNHEQKKS